jgi:hypothetical protein
LLSIEWDFRFKVVNGEDPTRSGTSHQNGITSEKNVGFSEDAAQSCSGYSAENLAVIRHIGINLLCGVGADGFPVHATEPSARDKKSKVGVKTRRLQAGWDDNYLKTVLSALNIVTT